MKNLVRTLVFGGQVSLTIADTTALVGEAITRHRLSPASAKTLGKALSAMTFASACLKEETGEISLSVKCDGACGELGVSGNRNLYMRGYITNTDMREDTQLLGGGFLTIVRDDGYSRPFVGACALPLGGGVDEAFEEYYRISEQLPTYIKTIVEISEDGQCDFAGVAVLQPLPFADENTLKNTQNAPLDKLLAQAKQTGVEEAARSFFDTDGAVWETREAVYKCNCSRARLGEVLISLGEAQMRQIIQEDGAVRVHCHYCNTDYEFTEEDARKLFPKK